MIFLSFIIYNSEFIIMITGKERFLD